MSKFMNDGMYSSSSCEWETQQKLFDELDAEFHFTLDPCSTDLNAKCSKHYTKEQNGLIQDWSGETVFCNPPYGKGIEAWCRKCYEHSIGGGTAVMLIPARTDTAYFHDWIYGKAEIRFLRGRIRYGNSKWNAPFPSMIAIFRRKTMNLPVYHSFDFVSTREGFHTLTKICMDGEELRGVEAARIDWEIDSIPRVTLTMLAGNINVIIPVSDVSKEETDESSTDVH